MHALKYAISGLALIFSLNAFAATVPSDFDQAKWQQLLVKIQASQNIMQIQAGELRYLAQIVPADTAKDHHAKYMSVLGNYDERQKYVVEDVSAVDEDWKIDSDNIWTIDQWTYHMSLNGDLIDVSHTQLRERDGQVLSMDDLKAGAPTDAAELQRYGSLLNDWTSQL
ncbi:MAG: hypothetical protein ACXVA9_12460 [Bdellovibrionales bacterium]